MLMQAHVCLCLILFACVHVYVCVRTLLDLLVVSYVHMKSLVWPVCPVEKTDCTLERDVQQSSRENKMGLNQMHQPAIFDTVAIYRAF